MGYGIPAQCRVRLISVVFIRWHRVHTCQSQVLASYTQRVNVRHVWCLGNPRRWWRRHNPLTYSMYVCMYVCIHVCMHVCMQLCMSVHMYACMYVCMYVPRLRFRAMCRCRSFGCVGRVNAATSNACFSYFLCFSHDIQRE